MPAAHATLSVAGIPRGIARRPLEFGNVILSDRVYWNNISGPEVALAAERGCSPSLVNHPMTICGTERRCWPCLQWQHQQAAVPTASTHSAGDLFAMTRGNAPPLFFAIIETRSSH